MRRLLIATVLTLGAGIAHADNGMLYLGAGITRDTLKDIAATNGDLDSTNWKIYAGFRPISLVAVEADYIDLGSETINGFGSSGPASLPGTVAPPDTHLQYKAFAGYLVGFAPIPVPYLDVFGKIGAARWTSSGGTYLPGESSSFFSLSDNGTNFAWGVGGQVHVGNFGGRLEYENFNIRNTDGANVISLSVFLNLF
jgi:OmpA-like transmembrane domain